LKFAESPAGDVEVCPSLLVFRVEADGIFYRRYYYSFTMATACIAIRDR